MSLLEAIMNVLNGPQGPVLFMRLHQAVLVCLALAVLVLFLAPRPGRKQDWLLACGLGIALLAVLAHQAVWQLAGFRRPEFVRFMRFHDPRPDAALKQVRRGSILDWRGTVLAESDPLSPWRRVHPLGAAACHVVGYMHPQQGVAGVERVADPTLCGYSFASLDELDRFGRNLLDHRAAGGTDVRLTLDAELQTQAFRLMAGRKGAVVVLRPDDGAIVCLLSVPGFDPDDPAAALANSDDAPFLNRATQGHYPPGSTFKMLVAGLAAERRLAPHYNCPGDGFVPARGARPIRDREFYRCLREGRAWPGRGRIGLREGFVHSSNVYFAQLGLALGADALNELVKDSRLTERCIYFQGVAGALAGEPADLPPLASQDRAETARRAIGQGRLVVTPLQVALWTAAIANGGHLPRPRLRQDAPPVEAGSLFSKAAAETVKALMRETVQEGTGRTADVRGLSVCGKTGTAEAPGGDDHAWFTCFAPAARPELVVTVLVEHGGYGSQAAAPVARALLETAVDLGLLGGDPHAAEPAQP